MVAAFYGVGTRKTDTHRIVLLGVGWILSTFGLWKQDFSRPRICCRDRITPCHQVRGVDVCQRVMGTATYTIASVVRLASLKQFVLINLYCGRIWRLHLCWQLLVNFSSSNICHHLFIGSLGPHNSNMKSSLKEGVSFPTMLHGIGPRSSTYTCRVDSGSPRAGAEKQMEL